MKNKYDVEEWGTLRLSLTGFKMSFDRIKVSTVSITLFFYKFFYLYISDG